MGATDKRRVPDPLKTDWHIGRAWTGHEIEDECRCKQERCGLIAQSSIDAECPQHGHMGGKTIRQGHDPRYCPARPAIVRLAVKAQDAAVARLRRRSPRSWRFDWRHPRASLGMVLGYGPHADGQAQSEIVSRLRWAASHYLGIGNWFWDGKDECRHCHAAPSDVDFMMIRVGIRRAECIESDECKRLAEEEAAFASTQQSKGGEERHG